MLEVSRKMVGFTCLELSITFLLLFVLGSRFVLFAMATGCMVDEVSGRSCLHRRGCRAVSFPVGCCAFVFTVFMVFSFGPWRKTISPSGAAGYSGDAGYRAD